MKYNQDLIAAALACAAAAPIFSCDLCSVYSASLARHELGSGFYAGISEQLTRFATTQIDGHPVPNEARQFMDSSISQILAGYNFSDRFGLQLNLPVIYRAFSRPEGFDIEHGHESGLGDVSLLAHFNAYRFDGMDSTFALSILGGLKFPTGPTDRIKEEFNEMETPGAPQNGIHGHDLTLGTGSVDGIAGTRAFWRWQRFFFSENVQYAIRTEGAFGYQFANDLSWSGGPGVYLLLDHDYSLGLQLNISGENKGRDNFAGVTAEDTGVTALYMGPQLNLTWQHHLSFEIAGDLPVTIQNTAFQTVPDYRVRAGVSWHF